MEGRREFYKEKKYKKKGARIFEEGRLKTEDVKTRNRNHEEEKKESRGARIF